MFTKHAASATADFTLVDNGKALPLQARPACALDAAVEGGQRWRSGKPQVA